MKNKTYHMITIGCQMNKSDSERIAGYLEKRGFLYSKNPVKSDLVIITTCGVRQSAEDRVYGLVPKIKKANKKVKVVITGCLSERKDVQRRLKDKVDIWLPIAELNGLAAKLSLREKEGGSLKNYLRIIPKYTSHFSAFVPIGNGCNNFCSYCVVPFARGREVYRPAEEILDEVKKLVKKGYKEIILIAQNVNSYKPRIHREFKMNYNEYKIGKEVNFAGLLRMVNDIPGNFWIRFATSHPKDISNELIKAIAECEKVCEHIHLPVQAGDNEILKRMNRRYTREHYISLIKKIRELNSKLKITNSKQIQNSIPPGRDKTQNFELPISITTDIIVGFPGETKKQFEKTAKLFRKIKFDMAYIAQYSPRPGTAALKMKDNVSKTEKKRREEVLMKILRKTALENNKEYLGKMAEVLIEEKNKRGEWLGKTRTFKNVKCQMSNVKCNIGDFIRVKINKVQDFGMEGKIV